MANQVEQPIENRFKPSAIQIYEYWGHVLNVVDGDTVDFEISLGFDISTTKRFRLLGIDTPEIYSVPRDSPEYRAGRDAADFLEQLLPVGSWAELKVHITSRREKYGRWLAEIFVNGENINEKILSSGHASRIDY